MTTCPKSGGAVADGEPAKSTQAKSRDTNQQFSLILGAGHSDNPWDSRTLRVASVGPGRAAMPTTPVIHITPSTLITEEPPKRAEEHSHNVKQIEGHAWSSTQSSPHPPCLAAT